MWIRDYGKIVNHFEEEEEKVLMECYHQKLTIEFYRP